MGEVRVEIPFKPYPHQRAAHALRLVARFLVLVWHRRAGKTVFAVAELVLAAVACTRPRGRFGYVAPYLKQAKGVAWDYVQDLTRPIPGVTYNETELSATLPNGAEIRIFGADNPEALRGLYFDGVVMDEVADMRPQVWGTVVRPALADRQGWAIFIGTPKGVNLFSTLYHEARSGADPEWAADVKRAADTLGQCAITPEEIEKARAKMAPNEFAQEFECDFAAAVENALVPLSAVLAGQERRVLASEYQHAPRVLGVDVARYGGDRNCLFLRQGPVAFKPRVFRLALGDPNGLMTVAGQVVRAITDWKPQAVFIDVGGYGAGVVDRCRQLGHDVIGIDFGSTPLDARYDNKRAEMWWLMAEWLKNGGGCLPDDQELVADLTAPTYTYANRRGKLALESKDDMKERGLPSPDLADALALTFAMPVAIPDPIEEAARRLNPVPAGGRTRHDYDPFEERRA